MLKGVVSFLVNPDGPTSITPAWADDIKGLHATGVRVPISCARDGSMPINLYREAVAVYQHAELEVAAVLHPGFVPANTADLHANMALQTTGDQLMSPFIAEWLQRVTAFAQQLVPQGLHMYFIWNEPNLLGMLGEGMQPPAGEKGSALAPEVFAALCWQSAERLKQAGATEVYCGSLSLLPQTGLDDANPFLARYLNRVYQKLAEAGKHAPWPWDGLALNSELPWQPGAFQQAVAKVRSIMSSHGDGGKKIAVGEWGWQIKDGAVDEQVARTTFAELSAAADRLYFFQHPGRTPFSGAPASFADYGVSQWRVDGPSFVIGEPYAWHPILQQLFAG
jgi:hypothetical protein